MEPLDPATTDVPAIEDLDEATATTTQAPMEEVSPETEAALWVQDDLRQSLARAAALCARPAPVWPARRFAHIEADRFVEDGNTVFHGMQDAQDPAVRIRALEALGASGGAADLDACLASLLDPVAAVRRAAADAVATLCQRPAHAQLAEQLLLRVFEVYTQWGFQERAAVDAALVQWRPILCMPALHALDSEETSPAHRAVAAYCLGRMGCHEACDSLQSLAWTEDKTLAREAAGALYRLRDPQSTKTWVDLTLHTDPVVQRLSVEALAALGDTVALEALVTIAVGEGGHSATQQILATNALAVWPKETSIPLLIRAMAHNPSVRPYAVARLREITGLPLGDMPDQWQAWYETGALPEGVTPRRTSPQIEVEMM